jgi:cytosine/adenosine deaminase-related metal-dependent hydrolase
MAGRIPPAKTFPDWVKTILSFKAHWSFSEYAESWLNGARMLIEGGTTLTADVESVPELLPEVWKSTPLRVISFLEMTGVKSQRPGREILQEALEAMKDLPVIAGKEAALSPHAIYSTSPDLLRLAAELSSELGTLLAMHLAESESEFQMLRHARGPFYEWLRGQRKMDDCGMNSPVGLASSHGLLSTRFLAVHVNYLQPGDAELLAEAGCSVVHCPSSHAYFQHDPFPWETLRRAGVNICLGTDSLASVRKENNQAPRLDMLREMLLFNQAHSGISPREILGLATSNGARALGKIGEAGCLKLGANADIAALAYSGRVNENAICEEVLHSPEVREVFIAGELVRSP